MGGSPVEEDGRFIFRTFVFSRRSFQGEGARGAVVTRNQIHALVDWQILQVDAGGMQER